MIVDTIRRAVVFPAPFGPIKPKIIPSEKGHTTVPSAVGLSKKGELIVGNPALDQLVIKPEQTIYGSKRLVGRQFNSWVVQRMIEAMSYPIVKGADGEAAVQLGKTIYSLARISAFILAEIRDMAQGQLEREIHRAVVTVPAYYNDNQRHAIKVAGKMAGMEVDRIINEPGHQRMKKISEVASRRRGKPEYDNERLFDKLTNVYQSGTMHEEDQPSHLLVSDLEICSTRCAVEYGNPCVHFCPAAVYEMVEDEADTTRKKLKINASNCVHCKTCDVMDPYQIITWVTPEGGQGPAYKDL